MEKNKSVNYRDFIAGIVIMALAVFFYCSTFGTKSFLGTGAGRTNADTIPKIVAVIMFILGAIILIKWFVELKRGKTSVLQQTDNGMADCTDADESQMKTKLLFQKITMPVTLVLIFCYIYTMPIIGFTISTFFFLTLQITLLSIDFSAKSWCKNIVIALIASVSIYVIFGCAFALAVPKVSPVDLFLGELYRSVFG
ncbi:MAG: tripartite tricarboxylate transporter TctB family protein [Clostridiales bacterium]|nr:tripartite tricarboxylate transporter TctB family protein [Clostridiales bacterium]